MAEVTEKPHAQILLSAREATQQPGLVHRFSVPFANGVTRAALRPYTKAGWKLFTTAARTKTHVILDGRDR